MALQITWVDPETGLPLNYHRITSIVQATNDFAQIQLCSYISMADREREKVLVATNEEPSEPVPIYTTVHYFNCEYTDGMTCTQAYEYLKTIPEFADATDVLEDEYEDL